jgi:hypothetical protein
VEVNQFGIELFYKWSVWYKYTIVNILAFALVAPSADIRLRRSSTAVTRSIHPDERA